MSYKVETTRIVPGGLNLITAGDQMAEGDCLDLMGFFPGVAGRVEVMPRSVVISGATASDSLCTRGGAMYYGNSASHSLYRAGASIDGSYDDFPLGMVSFMGYLWVMNRAKQRKDNGTTVSDWTPAAPTNPATLQDGGLDGSILSPPFANMPLAGGLSANEYSYKATWEELGETNPSPSSEITPALGGSIVRITRPTGAPAAATGWNVYRRVGGIYYRLNIDGPMPITATVADDYLDDAGDEVHAQSDVQLQQLGLILEEDHDAAPPAKIMANQIFNDRIVVANSDLHPNRIWYTNARQPGYFPGSADDFSGNWVDVGTDAGDEVLGVSVRPRLLIIYRAKSIWRQVGDFDDPDVRIEPLVPEYGIVGPHAFFSTSIGDFFRGPEGVYRLTDWAQKISHKVDSVWAAGIKRPENFTAGENDPTKCAIGFENGRLWVSYFDGAFQVGFVWHMDSDRWFSTFYGFTAFAPGDGELLGAGFGISQVRYGTPYNNVAYQSAYVDAGLPDHEKTYADLVIDHNTGTQSMTVTIRLNKNRDPPLDEFVLTTITSDRMTRQTIPLVYPPSYAAVQLRGLPIRAYSMSIRITGDSIPAGARIEAPILLHYYLEARRARTFDTDETDHGLQEVKTVDQVELDIDSSDSTAQLQLYTNLPGGVMIAGGLEGIIQTDARQVVLLNLVQPLDGRLLRYRIFSGTLFELYKMRARLLPLPHYLDGTQGDFWQPSPRSIGV